MSEDPIGFSPGDTNLNRYVGNGPVNGVDPSELEAPPLGPVSGWFDRLARQYPWSSPLTGTLSAMTAVFDTVPFAVREAARDARRKAIAHARNSDSVIEKSADYVIGVGINSAGELCSQSAFFYSTGTLFARVTTSTPLVRSIVTNPTVQRTGVLIGTAAAGGNAVEKTRNGQLTPSDVYYTVLALEGGRKFLLPVAPKRVLDPLDDLARSRGKSNLTDADTLARVEINGPRCFGVNSSAQPAEALALRREFLSKIQTQLGRLEGKQLNRLRALTNAEGHALMRACVRNGGNLGKEVTIHVDRITCNFCSGQNGVTLLRELMGIEKLTVIAPGRTVVLP